MGDNLLDNVLANLKPTDDECEARRKSIALDCNRIMNENELEAQRAEQRRVELAEGLAALLADPNAIDYGSTTDKDDDEDEEGEPEKKYAITDGAAINRANEKRLQQAFANNEDFTTLNLHWHTTPEEIARVEKAIGHKL